MSRRTPLVGWLTAEAVSLTGTRMSMVALPFLVLTTTGSATRTGLVALAEALPMVVLKVLGGPVIDRLGARRVGICCDLGSVVAVGAVPALHLAGLLAFPVLLALVAVAGALRDRIQALIEETPEDDVEGAEHVVFQTHAFPLPGRLGGA